MATSFISEHTAELVVIPYLKKKLEAHFDYVTPVFPWSTREGSSISRCLHQGDLFRVLAIFPRRPKFDRDDVNTVFVTINSHLLDFKEFAEGQGVPAIAGCPAAGNFWELATSKRPIFININETTTSDYLYPIKSASSVRDRNRLSFAAVVDMVMKSNEFTIEAFQEFLVEGRCVMPHTFFWGARYKPTYLLIKNR